MFAGLQAFAGVRGAGEKPGDYAVLMDADLQHPPALVRDMIVRLEETDDSVAARRVSRKRRTEDQECIRQDILQNHESLL